MLDEDQVSSATIDEVDDVDEDDDRSEFTVADELEGPFVPGPLPTPIDPEDGLPRHDVEPHDQGRAAPFAYDTVICIEDDRAYVEVWEGESSLPNVKEVPVARCRFERDGTERVRREFEPKDVRMLWGHGFVEVDGKLVPVRPRRERCIHYKRQVFADMSIPPGQFGHYQLHRLCTARRSNNGSHLSLRDEGIYVCDIREPFDAATSRQQDLIDADKLRTKPHLREIPLFGTPGEERVMETDPFAGGIFGTPRGYR